MLAHSPPLPLVIDYEGGDITTEDEEAITLALEHRDRVRHIRFNLPALKLQKPIGLVRLHLALYDPSTYFQPTVLLQSLSLMPQLEMLLIFFSLRCSQPRCEEATHAHARHDTRHAS
jgi:hypothetical protein